MVGNQLRHDKRVCERRDVPEGVGVSRGDLAEDAAHDLARALCGCVEGDRGMMCRWVKGEGTVEMEDDGAFQEASLSPFPRSPTPPRTHAQTDDPNYRVLGSPGAHWMWSGAAKAPSWDRTCDILSDWLGGIGCEMRCVEVGGERGGCPRPLCKPTRDIAPGS